MGYETEVVHPVAKKWLTDNGYEFIHECPLLGGRIDFVGYKPDTSALLLECKKDREGIESSVSQILDYRDAFLKVYRSEAMPALGMPKASITQSVVALCAKKGVRLIELSVDPPPLRNSREFAMVGFQASEDTDRDIIDWWEELPPGQRSQILRTLIRQYAIGGGEIDAQVLQGLTALRGEFKSELRRLTDLFKRGQFSPIAKLETEERLTEDEVEERKRKILERGW